MKKKTSPKKKYNKFAQKGLSADQRKKMREFFSYEPIWDIEDISHQLSVLSQEQDQHLKDLQNNDDTEEDKYSNYRYPHRSFRLAERGLELMGFQKLTDTLTQRCKRYRDNQEDIFQSWVHPQGVFVTLNTYGSPEMDGDRRLNSIHCETQLDVGSGFRLGFMLTQRGPSSSSNFTSLPQGRGISSQSFGSDEIFGLLRHLDARQSSGVLLPFDEWAISESHIHISPEMFLNDTGGLLNDQSSLSEGAQLLPRYLDAFEKFKNETLVNAPKGLVEIFEEGLALNIEYSEMFKDCDKPTFNRSKEFDWRSCEESLNYYDRLALYSLNRYENKYDRDFVQAWHEALVEKDDQSLDDDVKNHQTENGYHWLLCCAARLGYQERDGKNEVLSLFFKGVKEVKFSFLQHLCEQPDKTGMTFLVHLFNIASENSSITPYEKRSINLYTQDIIKAIAERYRQEGFALPEVGGDQATLGGVWLKNVMTSGRSSFHGPVPYDIFIKWKSEFENQGFSVNANWNTIVPYDCKHTNHRTFITPLKEHKSQHIGELFEALSKDVEKEQQVRNNFILKAILDDTLKDTVKEKVSTTRRM